MNPVCRVGAVLAKHFPFIRRFADRVTGMLSCFDRVIIKGYLPITSQRGMENFVDFVLRMRRADFLRFAEVQSTTLVCRAQEECARVGATYQFLKGRQRKEAIVDAILRKRGHGEGLVCVLATMECCRSFRLAYGEGRPELRPDRRQQRVLYFYLIDPDFGLLYIRLETWFPLTVQIYINGHSWLARQMARRGIGFVQHDNAFTHIDDGAAAQKLADSFADLSWPKLLDRLARRVHPLMGEPWFEDLRYYWVVDQAEYATDVLFSSRAQLAEIFPALLATATRFSPKDILHYLGRRLHHRFDGEVLTDCKTDRLPGARVKHRMKENWLKMYDKFGQIVRVETVINNPREFRVRRRCQRHGRQTMAYVPMNKGVHNLRHYRQVAQAANLRYLDALAAVEVPRAAYKDLRPLTVPKVVAGRRHAGFSPADPEHVRLFRTLLDGDHFIRGFRNADLRTRLGIKAADPTSKRRQSARIGRQLRRLHVRGLLARIPRTRRWRVTRLGQRLFQMTVHLYDHGVPTFASSAA
jgi:hypothetical protein